jgi:hypothetical protein
VIKGILVFFLIFGYGAVAILVKPYKSVVLNYLDLESTGICAVSMIGIVLIYQAGESDLFYLAFIFYFIVGIINLLFVI